MRSEKQIINDVMKELRFVGKSRVQLNESQREQEFIRKLDRAIDATIAKQVLTGKMSEPPKLTEQDYCELRVEIIKQMLIEKGMSKDAVEQYFKAVADTVDEAIKQHKEHIKNDFAVVKGGKEDE